jgi:mannose-6-phosphate isomerase-like protein (cupin superfamily)
MIIKPLKYAGSLIKPPKSKRLKAGLVILEIGEEVGEHVTENREEVIIILQGEALVFLANQKRTVKQNNLIYIPENKKHNLKNVSKGTLKYLYIVGLN